MSDFLNDPSPGTLASIQDLLGGSDPPLAVSAEELKDFLLGTGEEEGRVRVVRALASDRALRAQLTDLNDEMKRVERLSLSSSDEAEASQVLSFFETQLLAAVNFCSGIRKNWQEVVWNEVSSKPNRQAPLATTTYRAVAGTWRSAMTVPRFAYRRSGLTGQKVLAGGEITQWMMNLTNEGRLTVEVEFQNLPEALQERNLVLILLDPSGGFAPLGSAKLEGTVWSLEVPNFGALSGFSPSQLTPDMFDLCPEENLNDWHGEGYLLVHRGEASPIALKYLAPPGIREGVLTFAFQVDGGSLADVSGARLEIRIRLPNAAVMVWSGSIASPVQKVEVPIRGAQDGSLTCASVLEGRLVKIE